MTVDPKRVAQRLVRRSMRPPVRPVHLGSPDLIPRLPADYQAAAVRLVDLPAVNTTKYRVRETSVSREGSDVEIALFAMKFIDELKRRGMPFFPHCYLRDEATQNALLKRGVTKAKFGQSPHNYGMAVDIVHYGRFWDLSRKEWAIIGLTGKEVARRANIKITWGGDWKFYDPAHWELRDWKLIRDEGKFIAWPNPDWVRFANRKR